MKRMRAGMAQRQCWLSPLGKICKASSSGRIAGSSDIIMRSATPRAEEVLGEQIVMIDRTDGAGAICEHVREYAAGRRTHAADGRPNLKINEELTCLT